MQPLKSAFAMKYCTYTLYQWWYGIHNRGVSPKINVIAKTNTSVAPS